MSQIATQLLNDIQKDTVNFQSNFDGTLTEPTVLPGAVPNLLVNGATGIAVGMATSIPPHNLGEVVDAIHYMLERWEKLDDLSVEDLMAFVQGPDFPTGGIILHEEESDGLISAYSTGRGRVTVQASAHLEEMERGRSRIIITELPYMTNKSSLIERIAALVREERLDGIADLRDESDRQGMRIVIELNKAADPENVLSSLYKSTPMQSTFSINMLALVEGEPRLLSLKQALKVFIEHRLEIIRRRSEYDLEKARQRAHILEGLLVALNNLDEIIALIRKSPDAETARERLIKRFKLSLIQAQAILDMQLRRLAALERKKIEEEHKEVQALIRELEALLHAPKRMRQVIDQELQAIKATYSDRRRTHIAHLKAGVSKVAMLTSADIKPDKIGWVFVTSDGLIARTLDEQPPKVSGSDAPRFLIQANTRDTLYLVTDQGEAAAVPVHALPEAEGAQSAQPVQKISALKDAKSLAALFRLPPKERGAEAGEAGFVLTASRLGMLKKSSLSELPGPSANTFTLARVNDGDHLGWVRLTDGKNELLLASTGGMAIRFSEDEVRPMGLAAAGVMGIKLQENDELAGIEVLPEPGDLFLLASDGSAKRVPFEQFSRQGRYGLGLIAWKLPNQLRLAAVTAGSPAERIVIQLAKSAAKVIRIGDAPLVSRTGRGSAVLEVKIGDQITAVYKLKEKGSTTNQEKPSRAKKPAATKGAAAATPAVKAAAKKAPAPAPVAATAPPKKRAAPAGSPTKPAPQKASPQKTSPAKPPATKTPTGTVTKKPAPQKASPQKNSASETTRHKDTNGHGDQEASTAQKTQPILDFKQKTPVRVFFV